MGGVFLFLSDCLHAFVIIPMLGENLKLFCCNLTMMPMDGHPTNKGHLLFCPKNGCGGRVTFASTVYGHPHASMVKCPRNHDHVWWCCFECLHSCQWVQRRMLNKHSKEFHQNLQRPTTCTTTLSTEKAMVHHYDNDGTILLVHEDDSSTNHLLNTHHLPNTDILAQSAVITFSQPESAEFFSRDFGDGTGCSYLVVLLQFQNPEAVIYVEPVEVELQMQLAHLASQLSRSQNTELASILKAVYKKGRADVEQLLDQPNKKQATSWKTKIPTTILEMRKYIINGKSSILKNLPRPKVKWLDDSHACISVVDCFANLLAHGYEVEEIKEPAIPGVMGKTLESQVCMKILSNANQKHGSESKRITFFVEWYNDCDANANKKLRGGVFIKSVTFAAPPGFRNSIHYTYIVALEPQHADHECVDAEFAKDLSVLLNCRNTFYSKQMVDCSIIMWNWRQV